MTRDVFTGNLHSQSSMVGSSLLGTPGGVVLMDRDGGRVLPNGILKTKSDATVHPNQGKWTKTINFFHQ